MSSLINELGDSGIAQPTTSTPALGDTQTPLSAPGQARIKGREMFTTWSQIQANPAVGSPNATPPLVGNSASNAPPSVGATTAATPPPIGNPQPTATLGNTPQGNSPDQSDDEGQWEVQGRRRRRHGNHTYRPNAVWTKTFGKHRDENLDAYLVAFTGIADLEDWTDAERIRLFIQSLRGAANDVTIRVTRNTTWKDVETKFRAYWDPPAAR